MVEIKKFYPKKNRKTVTIFKKNVSNSRDKIDRKNIDNSIGSLYIKSQFYVDFRNI